MSSPDSSQRAVTRTSPAGLGLVCLMALAACAPSTDGPVLLVTSGFTDQILLLDPASGEVVGARDMDPRPSERDEPHAVAVAPDGRHWYATLSHGDPTLWKYESEGDRLVGRVSLGTRGAGRIGISPDSRTAIIPDYWLGGTGEVSDVVRVDLETLTVSEPQAVCSAPHDAVWSPDGERVAITCPLSDEIVVIDGESLDELWRQPVGPDATAGTPGNPRWQPMNLIWTPDGSGIVATLMRSGELIRFSADGNPAGRLDVGGSPTQLAITPDGGQIVVALRADFSAALVDVGTLSLTRRVAVPDIAHPHGVTIAPDGGTAFLSHEGTIQSRGGASAIALPGGEVLWSREAGVFNLGIAWRGPPAN